MTVYKTATSAVPSKSLEKCKGAIEEFVDYVRTNERGT
jgi:hypothetical protein